MSILQVVTLFFILGAIINMCQTTSTLNRVTRSLTDLQDAEKQKSAEAEKQRLSDGRTYLLLVP